MNLLKRVFGIVRHRDTNVKLVQAADELTKLYDVLQDRMTDIEASLRELEKKDRERHAEIRVLHSRVTYLMREHNDYSN